MKRKKNYLKAYLVCLFALLALSGCTEKPDQAQEEQPLLNITHQIKEKELQMQTYLTEQGDSLESVYTEMIENIGEYKEIIFKNDHLEAFDSQDHYMVLNNPALLEQLQERVGDDKLFTHCSVVRNSHLAEETICIFSASVKDEKGQLICAINYIYCAEELHTTNESLEFEQLNDHWTRLVEFYE